MVDYTTKSSTLSDVSPHDTIISEKSNTVNTGYTVDKEEIIKLKKELQRWYSILTPEYNRWQVGEYMDTFLLTTEWVKTKEESELEEE